MILWRKLLKNGVFFMKTKGISFLIAALLIGSTLGPVWAAAEPENYFPLQVGNTWNFDVHTGGQTMQMEYRAVAAPVVENHPTVRIESEVNGTVSQVEYYETTPQGVLTIQRDLSGFHLLFAPPQVFLKYPVKTGDSWDQKGTFSDESRGLNISYQQQCKYLAMEEVTVPAGTFKAVKLQITIDTTDGTNETRIEGYRYFSPGVGPIKEDFKISIQGMEIPVTGELTSYKLAAGEKPLFAP